MTRLRAKQDLFHAVLTAFEVLVAILQAYIFTILAAVYINNSMAGHGDDH